jgi:rod shape-determining protein MreD
MALWLGTVMAFSADLVWHTFLPGLPRPQLVALWLLRESVRRDDYHVPSLAFVAGVAWDATLHGILGHHAVLWLLLVLLARRLTVIVWFDHLVTQVLLAMFVSFLLRGAESMIWLPRWPTDVGQTRIFDNLVGGVALDGLFFPFVWRLHRAPKRRSVFETMRL